MIKIEITDVLSLSARELRTLANYLRDCADDIKEGPMLTPEDKAAIDYINDVIDDKINPLERPAPDDKPIIEEELIPVVNFNFSELNHDPKPEAIFGKCASIPEPPPVIPVPPQSVELDCHGLPWDRRIHARTRTKNKDGSWKRLRGLSNTIVDKIESQLKSVQDLPPVPVLPSEEQIAAPGFADMMSLITGAISKKTLERHDIMKVLDRHGIPSIPIAATRPDLIPAIILELKELINEK